MNADSKGVRLGLYQPKPESERKRRRVVNCSEILQLDLLHCAAPAIQTPEGLRALNQGGDNLSRERRALLAGQVWGAFG